MKTNVKKYLSAFLVGPVAIGTMYLIRWLLVDAPKNGFTLILLMGAVILAIYFVSRLANE